MKKTRRCSQLLIILIAGLLMTSCSTYRGAIPQKKPAPPIEVPELGARPSPGPSPYHSHGIVLELTAKARRQMKAGELDHAFSTLERALKIDPSDPVPWNMLAEIQLKRGNMEQAEQLARKSNLLAGSDKALRGRNWLIIAEVLEGKGFSKEAEAAKRRAGN